MIKSLRVIVGSLHVGGTEKHLATLLPALKKEGWQIRIITTQMTHDPNLIPIFEAFNIHVQVPPKWFRFRYLPKFFGKRLRLLFNLVRLYRDFRKDSVSLTHFFLPEAYLLGMSAAMVSRLKAPTIMSRRSLNYYQKKWPMMRWLELQYHKKVNFVLGNSNGVLQQLTNEEQVSKNKLRLIYNGIDAISYNRSHQRQSIRQRLGLKENSLVLIMVANLIAYKGHEDLLTALGLIREKLPSDWQLLCVGRDDGILLRLQQIARDQKIESQVCWLGSRNDVSDLLVASDIGVLSSHEEGFSNAVLEAMAAGLPLVVTDVGGNAEAVVHGKTGFVVPPKNPEALSQALLTLARDPFLSRLMGEAGRERVVAHFSLEKCVSSYQQFYEECLCVG